MNHDGWETPKGGADVTETNRHRRSSANTETQETREKGCFSSKNFVISRVITEASDWQAQIIRPVLVDSIAPFPRRS